MNPEGVPARQRLVHRKKLNLKIFHHHNPANIWTMVEYWTIHVGVIEWLNRSKISCNPR